MRNPSTPQVRDSAQRLLAEEAAATTASQAGVPVAFRVCEKLRLPLTTLAGPVGFQSLMSRALTLTKREAPSLRSIELNQEGSLKGDVEPSLDHQDSEGEVVLVAHLLGLLCSVVGETLTLRLIHDVWPDAYFSALTAEGTAKHER